MCSFIDVLIDKLGYKLQVCWYDLIYERDWIEMSCIEYANQNITFIFEPDDCKLFENPNFVSLTTLDKDGTPLETAIWVDIESNDILLKQDKSRDWIVNCGEILRLLCIFLICTLLIAR